MSDEKDFGLDGQWGEAVPAGDAEPAAPAAGKDPDEEIIDLDFDQETDGENVNGSSWGEAASGSSDGEAAPGSSADGAGFTSADSEAASGSAGGAAASGPVPGFSPKTGEEAAGEHDWEEDEPKYDTQTGERLDRPKPKWPGIILTAVVTVATLGSLIYASIPGLVKENHTVQTADDADTETEEAVLSIADGSKTEETEAVALTIADGSKTEETEAVVLSIADGSRTVETEGTDEAAEQLSAAVPESETEEELSPASAAVPAAAQQAGSLTDIVQSVMPCVVSVTAASPETVGAWYEGGGNLEGIPFCSGFIVQEDDESLYILTDRQIAADAQDLTVGFNTGAQDAAGGLAKALLTGSDEETSLALLKVEKSAIAPETLAQVQMGQINAQGEATVGETVAMVGKTVSYGPSVMQGIICAVSARMDAVYGQSEYILTDVPVNALNNGGPLVNMGGEVIGIAAADPAVGASDGMSRILPFREAVQALDRINGANQAEALLSAVMPAEESAQTEEETPETAQRESEEEDTEAEADMRALQTEAGSAGEKTENAAGSQPEEAERTGNAAQGGQLGIHVAEINDERQIIDRLPAGVYIADVISASGAWEAGLAAGDVIIGLGGRQTRSLEELREVLGGTKAGDKIQVSYLRADDRGRYNEKKIRRTLVTLS